MPSPTCSITDYPTFRTACLNTVAIVPLLSSASSSASESNKPTHSHSLDSFERLFTSLAPFAASPTGRSNPANELTLIIPNSNLTRPGEWKYDSTPLKSHDWSIGYQRMVIFDGRENKNGNGSPSSRIRLSSFHKDDQDSEKNVSSPYADYVDLYPSRGISAVIGVLDLKDCASTDDLHNAEKELASWTRKYTPNLYGETTNSKSEEDNPIHPRHFVTQRIFVFDSCDDTAERKAVDLSQTKLYKFEDIVAFPPIGNMDMHLNVVVNNLAVAILLSLERRIKALDETSSDKRIARESSISDNGLSTIADIVGPESSLNSAISNSDTASVVSSVEDTSTSKAESNKVGLRRKAIGLAASAVKALNKQNSTATDKALLSKMYQFSTPLDPPKVATSEHLSSKEVDHLLKRNIARREKYSADLALLAGSPLDAYDRYTRAAELTKNVHDSIWYAASLEGLATSFVAMADCGGHGADAYLENNFQYPADIMASLLADNMSTNEEKEKIDKSKTTMPAAIYALVDEAYAIFNRKMYDEKLSSICAELLLKTAWYVAELVGLHIRCQWGRGLVGDIMQSNNIPSHLLTASSGTYSNRWEMTSVSKLDIQNMRKKENDRTLLGSYSLVQCRKFTELLHRCVTRKLDPYTKVFAACWCTKLCLIGVQVPVWDEWQMKENSFNRLPMPRKAAFFAGIAAETMTGCTEYEAKEFAAKLWTASSSLYSNERNGFISTNRYGWSTLRASILHDVCQKDDGKSAEKAAQQLLALLSEISLDCSTSSRDERKALKRVVSKMGADSCEAAQIQCINRLSELRQSIPATTVPKTTEKESLPFYDRDTPMFNPLQIKGATIIKSESHLLLHRIRAAGFTSKDAMSTFFNPYANKKKDEGTSGKKTTTLVAGGEERSIEIEFANNLSVPLSIPTAKLEFDTDIKNLEIEAPPLSFTIPKMSKSFKVFFPFTIAPSRFHSSLQMSELVKVDEQSEENNGVLSLIDLVGLKISCFNRSLEYRFDGKNMKQMTNQIPSPAFLYQRSLHNATAKGIGGCNVTLETIPAQPNLLVSFASSPTPLDDDAVIPVHLSDGEIYTIPSFRLENDFGPSGLGNMERLQIVGVGLPGLPEEILFDTDELAKALEEKEDNFNSDDESETFEELMESDGLPPLKMKCLAEGLSLKSINDKNKSLGEGSHVMFQIAATHDMGNQLANGGNVRIRFRYRGPSCIDSVEIWRKREIALRIVRIKGPRISSLTFRSDLSWGSAFSDLCWALAIQRKQMEKIPNWETSQFIHRRAPSEDDLTRADSTLSNDIGFGPGDVNKGVFVSGNDVVVLMAVANETNSTIILSNRLGKVGGFDTNPMRTVKVTSGVSVKIPIVIPRIHCLDENGDIGDIATELITRTALTWESVAIETGDTAIKRARHGRVRVPSRCLREIIDEHKDFATRCHKPPVSIDVAIDGKESSIAQLNISTGSAIDCIVDARIQDWVHSDILSSCSMTLEFCAAKQNSVEKEEPFIEAFAWCGQVRKTIRASKSDLRHNCRICFFRPGEYVLSACVKMCGYQTEEIWWAPTAKLIKVERKT